MGVGETVNDKKMLDHAVADMTRIAGQKPVVTKTRKSIANFKVRAGYPVGCMVTLRGARMYEFLDRLVNIAIPRIRDFRGVSNRAFDGRGSYSLGVKEQIIFPEIEYDKIDALRGHGHRHQHLGEEPTTRRARCSPRSASRSGRNSRQAARTAEGLTNMAKLSVKLREKKRRNTVAKFKAKRAALLEIDPRPEGLRRGPRRRARQAAEAAARRLARRGCATAAR